MKTVAHWDKVSSIAMTFADQWKGHEPGGAIIGFDTDGIKFAHAGGLESLSTLKEFTPDSVVRYASVTKHAFCAMVLKYGDIISLNDTLGQHLPELQAPLADVTVGQALDMTAGLPDTRECLTLLGLSIFTETNADRLVEFLAGMTRLNFDAGTEISYSNTGYRLVETALERKGLRFNDFVEQDIAAPLGVFMNAPDVWTDPVMGLVPGYWNNSEKWQLSAAGLHISAAGSLSGSGVALAEWARALVNGSHGFDGLLSKLSSDRHMADGRVTGYGLGLRWNDVGGRDCVGHGGSHPGYKSYFLVDPERKTGFVVVANRDDVNSYRIARDCMAALYDLQLPQTNCTIPDGLYVTESDGIWVEMKGGICNYLDSEDTLYDLGDGSFSSLSSSSPVHLRWTGEALEGEIGYKKRKLLPAIAKAADQSLDGRWEAKPYGAFIDIKNGHVEMGIGPTRNIMPLTDIGHGRYLFTLHDGPWTKRICLNKLDDNHFELILSRARMIEYTRN